MTEKCQTALLLLIVVLNLMSVHVKMAPKKSKFTAEDKEKLIEFVKSHEILYNVKNKDFRNTEKKNRLWSQLSNTLNTDGLYCYCILL